MININSTNDRSSKMQIYSIWAYNSIRPINSTSVKKKKPCFTGNEHKDNSMITVPRVVYMAMLAAVNSIGAYNSIRPINSAHVEKKKPCFTGNEHKDNSMVTVPRVVYMAMLAAVLGGGLQSCGPDDPFEPNPIVVPTDTVPSTETNDNIMKMINVLQLASVTDSTKGDVVKLDYHDNYFNTDTKLNRNEKLTTIDKTVFDGTNKDLNSGQLNYVRHTYTSIDNSIILKEQITKKGKPTSENTGWIDGDIYKYVPTADGLEEYLIFSDGSEHYQSKIVPNTPTSVTKIYDSGTIYDVTNISIEQK